MPEWVVLFKIFFDYMVAHYLYKLKVDRNVLDSLTGLKNRQEQAMFNYLSKYKKEVTVFSAQKV